MTSISALHWSPRPDVRVSRPRLKPAAVALLVAALAACAGAPPVTQQAVTFKRVGVASVAAGALTQRAAGARVSDGPGKARDIADWAVDRAYEDQIAAAVQITLGATPVKAPPLAALSALNDPANPYVQPGFWAYRTDPVAASVREYCASNSLDAVVVASQSTDEDALGGSYLPLKGAGIYAKGTAHLIHLSAMLSLIDCETGRPLERRRVASGRSFAGSHGYPVRELSAAIARKGVTQGTPGEDSQLKQALVDLPADAWVDTLEGMVHPAYPPVFGRTMLPNS